MSLNRSLLGLYRNEYQVKIQIYREKDKFINIDIDIQHFFLKLIENLLTP